MSEYQHVLVIGGTGMLQAASIRLGVCSNRLITVARTERSLRNIDTGLLPGSGFHHRLKLDWSNSEGFLDAIINHIESTEPPDLVVAWIHDDELTVRLFSLMAENSVIPRFCHIIGSASENPKAIADSLLADMPRSLAEHYHQVILGAKGKGVRARWLTNHEISEGVLEAVKTQHAQFLVGTLERYH